MAVRGKIQREGAVVHLVARHLTDLSDDLASVGERLLETLQIKHLTASFTPA